MQTITETIPALAKIQPVIDNMKKTITLAMIKDLDIPENETAMVKIPQFWVAGGAALSAIAGTPINDYDIFSPEPNEVVDWLKKGGFKEVSRIEDYLVNLRDPWNNHIQVITRFSPLNVEALFETFDFTISCAAYDGTKFSCHDRFFQDVATRRLVMNKIHWPLKTLERVAKYSRRGYTACPFGLLDLCKAINALEVDWNNPDQNHLAFYPDGSPRFNGVD